MSEIKIDRIIKISVVLLALMTWMMVNITIPFLPELAQRFHIGLHGIKIH